MIPVKILRIVDTEANVLLCAFIRQLLDDIALERGCIHNIVIGVLRIEETETVMVFGCDHDILHARRLGQRDPIFGIELDRVELRCKLRVFLPRNLCAGHDPF